MGTGFPLYSHCPCPKSPHKLQHRLGLGCETSESQLEMFPVSFSGLGFASCWPSPLQTGSNGDRQQTAEVLPGSIPPSGHSSPPAPACKVCRSSHLHGLLLCPNRPPQFHQPSKLSSQCSGMESPRLWVRIRIPLQDNCLLAQAVHLMGNHWGCHPQSHIQNELVQFQVPFNQEQIFWKNSELV